MAALQTTVANATGVLTSVPLTSGAIAVPLTSAVESFTQPTAVVTGTMTVAVVTPTITSVTTNAAMPSTVLTAPLVKSAPTTDRTAGMSSDQVLNKDRIKDLVKEIDPNEQLDDDVEELLLQMADDFIENVVTTSCLLAKHRKSNSLETKDIQLCLEKNYNMWIPGFGSEELQTYKKSTTTEAHKQRLALIRKTLKKS